LRRFWVPGYLNPGFGCGAGYGRGFGRGFGRARGFCRGFFFAGAPAWAPSGYPVHGDAYAPTGKEKDFLSQQAEILENQLEQVKKRLQELDGRPAVGRSAKRQDLLFYLFALENTPIHNQKLYRLKLFAYQR
jgi:hypothetical protein